MITIYSKRNCQYCEKAKTLLQMKGITYEEIKVDDGSLQGGEAYEFLVSEGHRSVPQIYQNGKLLVEGGFVGLEKQTEEFFNQLKGEVICQQ